MSAATITNPPKETTFPFQCPILTSSNYTTWAIKMEAVLDAQGLWESIEPTTGVVVDEKKSKTARAFLFQAIPEEILLQVAKKKTAKEVWDSLKVRFIGAERVQKARLHTLKSEFESLRMKDGETIDEYAGKLSGMISKYNSVGAILKDSELVQKLFDTVTEKYIHLVASMEQYSDVEEMPFDEAIGRLKAYEDRLKLKQGTGSSSDSSLLFAKSEASTNHKGNQKWSSSQGRGKSGARGGRTGSRGGRGGGRGRGKFYPDNSNRKPRDKSQVKCYECNQLGHYASECPSKTKQDQEVHLTRDNEDEAALLLSIGEEKATVVSLSEQNVFLQNHDSCDEQKDVWYLDNGASNHMSGQKEIFAELDGSVTGGVRFGDGSKVEIKGKGTLLCQCKNGDQLLIPDVYYIPALTSSILSIGQMTEEGYDVSIKDEFLKLQDEQGRLLMKVRRSPNRLYKIKITSAKPVCLSSRLEEEAWIWHVRLGHVNFQLLELMAKRGCVRGLPALTHPRQVCEGCLLAKQTRGSFSKEAQWRAKEPLELLHADLCGPITPLSKGGNRYIFLIVDDFSRYMWVYLLKTKDEALSKFKIFKTEVEKETGFAIKMLRTDQGGITDGHESGAVEVQTVRAGYSVLYRCDV
ncbi:hypothetical protein E3N88_26543 [Mikania micrantha]|uniref:CCHC-type domain-containing protein n=1 Tax=Mikania micrantha TaxID=192012 RepID=A0A5N6MX58_9ASTR|nr:hypothetical protein E3N88_26543 [Mikania micrantha]